MHRLITRATSAALLAASLVACATTPAAAPAADPWLDLVTKHWSEARSVENNDDAPICAVEVIKLDCTMNDNPEDGLYACTCEIRHRGDIGVMLLMGVDADGVPIDFVRQATRASGNWEVGDYMDFKASDLK